MSISYKNQKKNLQDYYTNEINFSKLSTEVKNIKGYDNSNINKKNKKYLLFFDWIIKHNEENVYNLFIKDIRKKHKFFFISMFEEIQQKQITLNTIDDDCKKNNLQKEIINYNNFLSGYTNYLDNNLFNKLY